MVVLYYTIFSAVPECLEFSVEITGEVSITFMLSFSYEDSINVYSFIAQVTYRPTQVLHMDLHELHIQNSFFAPEIY